MLLVDQEETPMHTPLRELGLSDHLTLFALLDAAPRRRMVALPVAYEGSAVGLVITTSSAPALVQVTVRAAWLSFPSSSRAVIMIEF